MKMERGSRKARSGLYWIPALEGVGFLAAIVSCWVTEYFDPPFSLQQVGLDTLAIGVVGVLVVRWTLKAEKGLRQQTLDLMRSNEDLQQFANIASHDLQEPIRMVKGFMQLLSEQYGPSLDAKAGEFVRYALDGAERMSRMIRGVMAYSRIESDGPLFQEADCQAVAREAGEGLSMAIRDSGGSLEIGLLPTVWGHAAQLQQVFQNLIGNALKFREDRAPVVRVSARRTRKAWEFCVRDNGIGMDPGQMAQLFVMFRRLHDRAKYPGAGIGLAACKKIVERHGGKIWAESSPGEGSAFFFTIPDGSRRSPGKLGVTRNTAHGDRVT